MSGQYHAKDYDPWDHVDDIDGMGHYTVLGVKRTAKLEEIKRAYREMARKHHPDKGGDPQMFGQVRKAWETLSDPQARETYDTWMKELKYRFIPGVTPRAEGGEDILLDDFERMGIFCDANTQLVILCEVCGRPSNKECWVCTCRYCDFCERKQHWKGRFGLHYAVHNVPSMRDELAKKELERKRVEDAKRMALEDPNFREEHTLKEIRAFKEAATALADLPNNKVTYDLKTAKCYMWSQTARFVYVAVYVPTGYVDKEIHMEVTPSTLLLQPEDSPPVIDRLFSGECSQSEPIDTFKAQDNTFITLAIPKKIPGEKWKELFKGDSTGARCMQPPYKLLETNEDVTMEIQLPFWIDKEDCFVEITPRFVHVRVRNEVELFRTYWRDTKKEKEPKGEPYKGVVDAAESSWCLDDEENAEGEPCKVLQVTFVKPALSDEEKQWKKGKQQDNRVFEIGGHKKGVRFFLDDEDYFQCEDILQALCFLETGESFVPAKPYDKYHFPFAVDKWATHFEDLSKEAQKQLELMLDMPDGDDDDDGGYD